MNKVTAAAFAILASILHFTASAQNSYCKHQNPVGEPEVMATANDTRSDSIDITKTTINLTITDFAGQAISGNAKINFKAKINGINILRIDLLSLTVDSVKRGSQHLTYNHTAEIIRITLPATLNTNQADSLTIYYHGQPVEDPSGYGGFYFSGGYAYSIGVGFAAIPHNFGRCWFPCFDNFVERSLFEFNITTSTANTGVCNGTLQSTIDNGNGTRTFKWTLQDDIPSYLACVSVAPYVKVTDSYASVGGGNIPVIMYCLAGDTTELKNSFTNLHNAFDVFEAHFGAYPWEKVGYVLVPFTAGAMEHATCISYPTFIVNGLTTYETTMAHELSHMWFGDLATCDRAEEMYLNEGFARYCEALFLESVYDYDKYMGDIRDNHKAVMHFAHVKDAGYHALSEVPQAVTYGSHSYEKGADVLHTLRSYMGDSLFFNGVKSYLNNNQFVDVNSITFKNELEAYSGMDLDDFFNGWILNPGFTHFSIDSFKVTPNGNQYDVAVYVRQKLTHAPALFNNIPFNLTFKSYGWDEEIRPIVATGANSTFSFTLPFYPALVALNMDEKISHAITAEKKVVKNLGSQNFANAYLSIDVTTLPDSVFMYVEHNWTAPDQAIDNGDVLTLSPNRYWKVTGIAPAGFVAAATFSYNGKTPVSGSSGWLDNELITTTEDSLILLYRPNSSYPWKRYNNATLITQNSSTDKLGRFEIDTLRFGEYCLGKGFATVSVSENYFNTERLKVYPNPAQNILTVEASKPFTAGAEITILNTMGMVVKTVKADVSNNKQTITIDELAQGMYYLRSGTAVSKFMVY